MSSQHLTMWIEEKFPEWTDDLKSRALFSSFLKPRSVNPEAHDQKLHFWESVLLQSLGKGVLCTSVFRLPDSETCSSLFQRKGVRPLGLAFVFTYLLNKRAAKFSLDSCSYEGVDSIIWRMAKMVIDNPLISGVKWLAGANCDTEIGDMPAEAGKVDSIVLLPLLEDTSGMVMDALKDQLLRVFSIDEFFTLVNNLRISSGLARISDPEDLELLLSFMKSLNSLALIKDDVSSVTMIKVKSPQEKMVNEITQEEYSFIYMKTILGRIEKRQDELTLKIMNFNESAKMALLSGDRELALHQLRKSRLYQATRLELMNKQQNLLNVIDSLDRAQTNTDVVKALRAGFEGLEGIKSKNNVTIEQVDDLMLELKDQIREQNYISESISAEQDILSQEDEEILQLELAKLVDGQLSQVAEAIPPNEPLVTEERPQIGEAVHERAGADDSDLRKFLLSE